VTYRRCVRVVGKRKDLEGRACRCALLPFCVLAFGSVSDILGAVCGLEGSVERIVHQALDNWHSFTDNFRVVGFARVFVILIGTFPRIVLYGPRGRQKPFVFFESHRWCLYETGQASRLKE
jgi:hypothetical protein